MPRLAVKSNYKHTEATLSIELLKLARKGYTINSHFKLGFSDYEYLEIEYNSASEKYGLFFSHRMSPYKNIAKNYKTIKGVIGNIGKTLKLNNLAAERNI